MSQDEPTPISEDRLRQIEGNFGATRAERIWLVAQAREAERLRRACAEIRDRSRLGEQDGKPWVIVEYGAWRQAAELANDT